MSARLPTLFLSHGSPMLALGEGPTQEFLRGLAATLPRPRALLVVSAHWETAAPTAGTAAAPEMIYDFFGFPQPLFEIVYPAPGAPEVGERAAALLEEAGFPVSRDPARGFDHGVWVPLTFVYPDADLPVAQVSIQPEESPAHHYRMGEALRPLRDEGVLIVATGSLSHNLREYRTGTADGPPEAWVADFAGWFAEKIADFDIDALLDYRNAAPSATRNHPTDEHLLPLYVALGAATADDPRQRLHAAFDRGVLALDAYRFG